MNAESRSRKLGAQKSPRKAFSIRYCDGGVMHR